MAQKKTVFCHIKHVFLGWYLGFLVIYIANQVPLLFIHYLNVEAGVEGLSDC